MKKDRPSPRPTPRLPIALCLAFLLSLGCAPSSEPPTESATEPTLAETSIEPAPGLIHSVFFWLREDLTDEERNAFVEGNRSMSTIPSVRRLYFGPPAATEAREVVDNSFDYALILHFDDLAGQNAYQVHPLHQQMVEQHSDKWTRVVVHDSQVLE